MKFGVYLKANVDPTISSERYLAYDELKGVIKRLTERKLGKVANASSRMVSLSMPPPTNLHGAPVTDLSGGVEEITQEHFFKMMDGELEKVEQYTTQKVRSIRESLDLVEKRVSSNKEESEVLKEAVDSIGAEFLKLEKYVNLNFTGFHKILKKHDKNLPNPCKSFYVSRMHSQAWVRGDYSDIVVRMSKFYSEIRGDHEAKEKDAGSQAFMRSTTKYWVNTDDISKVKYAVLQHLPVFLQKTATGETDSQLTNSVYLDNSNLELYHGRLDKTPGAIALRLRWYGNGAPETVFVERKTHRDTWTGEVSVKERFIIKEKDVKSVMNGTYDIEGKKREMIEKGKSKEEIADWELLVREITQAINTKICVPTMRTQYMRTAFQIPFDATVRVSLDTNLCMISERGYDLEGGKRWHRDEGKPIRENEIARFPHAVLEIKLEVKEGQSTPEWVENLQNSGMLYEVHKFSKFIHGCATLLPEDVQAVPYWVDDASLVESIIASGAKHILTSVDDEEDEFGDREAAGPGANQIYPHLLPHGTTKEKQVTGETDARTSGQKIKGNPGDRMGAAYVNFGMNYCYDTDEDDEVTCWPTTCCYGYQIETAAPTSIQKVEPKTFFANERTFIHWLHMAVLLSGVASGILAFSQPGSFSQWYGVMLLPVSMFFCVYALHTFLWRAERIRIRIPGRWDDPLGPIILAVIMVGVLSLNFLVEFWEIVKTDAEL